MAAYEGIACAVLGMATARSLAGLGFRIDDRHSKPFGASRIYRVAPSKCQQRA
jgi:hypothetical protein